MQTCEEARVYPELVRPEDVRFVECDRKVIPDVEAFRLGDPIVRPSLPGSLDAVEYAPGQCAHKGGGISTLSVFYRPENVDAAIECSRARCEAGEGVACQDLGWLYSDQDLGGLFRGRRPNAALSTGAFERGCTLGHAEACYTIASRYERNHDARAAAKYFERACNAAIPVPRACLAAAEELIAEARDDEALPYLRRGCRGTSMSSNAFLFPDRQGCALLARRAKLNGDVVSYREYLRLECAFGGSERTLAACEELGLLLMVEDPTKATRYLRKACATHPTHQVLFERSCKALEQLTHAGSGVEKR